jgi:hypothetical protein
MFHSFRATASCLAIVATVAVPARGQLALVNCSAPALEAGADANAQPEDVALLFTQYQCALAAQEYGRALSILDRVCAGPQSAACAFNRALVYHAWLETPGDREQEHCQLARKNYVEFLALNPYQEQNEEARGALAELDDFCASPAPGTSAPAQPIAGAISVIKAMDLAPESLPAATTSAPPGAPAADARAADARAADARAADARAAELRRTLSWGLLGLGSAAAVAATVSWLHMLQADADLVEQRQPDGTIQRTVETRALDHARRDYQQMAWGLGAAAIPLLGLGALGLLLTPQAPSQLSGAIGPGLIEASYRGVF